MSMAANRPDPTPATGSGPARPIWRRLLEQREMSIFLVVLAGGLYLHLASPNFLQKTNLIAVLLGLSFDAIIAVGMTVLLVSGGFDLSVGSVLALGGAVAGYAMTKWGFGVGTAILLGLLAGALVGYINGWIIARVGVNPLIGTLGMMSIARGAVLLLTAGYGIPNLPDPFNKLGQGVFLGMQYPVWIMLLTVIVGELMLRRSRFFRQSYFVGGNERSARLSGINVERVKITNYILVGVMAALTGLLLTARLGTASVSAGMGAELRVISAVVIGGASLSGGEGSVVGSLLGVILMALISNGLNLLGVNVYWQTIVIGTVLVLAVAADTLSRRRRR